MPTSTAVRAAEAGHAGVALGVEVLVGVAAEVFVMVGVNLPVCDNEGDTVAFCVASAEGVSSGLGFIDIVHTGVWLTQAPSEGVDVIEGAVLHECVREEGAGE